MKSETSPNYYEVLQLQPYANQALVIAAYRILSKLYHPDTAREEADIGRFRLLQEAYDTLSDPQKRLDYDRELRVRTPFATDFITPDGEREREHAADETASVGTQFNGDSDYTPDQEDLEFYKNLYDYEAGSRPRRTLILLIIFMVLMAGGILCGFLGLLSAFGNDPDGAGYAVIYFGLAILLIIAAQVEAYFS